MFNLFKKKKKASLEQQLEHLEKLGFKLEKGVTKDDLLYSFNREEYEKQAYDLIFIALGFEVEREPWGRPFCSKVWNFDFECIDDHGSYTDIVNNLCRIANTPTIITNLKDFLDIEANKAWLEYTIDTVERYFDIPIDDDWADAETVVKICNDIERDGKLFYAMDNGQAAVMFYLSSEEAQTINKLSPNKLLKFKA